MTKSKFHIFNQSFSLLVLIISLLFAPFLLFSQNKPITVSGSVQFDVPGTKMQIFKGNGPDKVVVAEFDIDKENRFNQQLVVDEPGLYTLDCKKAEIVRFWAEDENIEVNFRGADTARVRGSTPFRMIKGGPKNEVINQLNFITQRYNLTLTATYANIRTLASASKEEKESLIKVQSEQIYNDYRERLAFLYQLYPDRTSMVAVLNYINYSKDRELIDKIAANIYAKHPGYAPLVTYYKVKEETAANARKMVVGAIAPDFEFPSPDGKMVGPKDYRGKILVIDFWASWCKPCVAEIPNLKKLHEKYKESGLEVLSVSIDKDSKEWLLALEKYAMPWKQVLAPKAGADITKLYQFNLIPFIIIIDREGRIIGKNQRGEALDSFIKEHIK